jgi:DNA-binding CsgD family transcriptional regulator
MSEATTAARPSRALPEQPRARIPQHDDAVAGALITRGAELVVLTEELYLRLFRLACAFLLAACPISVWFGGVRGHEALTWVFAVGGAVFAVAGVGRPRPVYCWLRHTPARQLLPAAAGAVAVLLNAPDSPSWWIALGLLLLTPTVGSARLSLALAAITAAAYLAGTTLGGMRLIGRGDAGVLAGGVGLVAYTLVACFVVDAFTRFVLGLHRLEREVVERREPPLRVPGTGAAPTPSEPAPRPRSAAASRARSSLLTVRQLEAVLLARDGLKQPEIAGCMGISPRQVERLLADARERTGAGTTSHLVAMLIADGIAP